MITGADAIPAHASETDLRNGLPRLGGARRRGPSDGEGAGARACGTANLLDGRKALLAPEIKGDLRLVTDSAAAQEGAQWDAPAAVTLDARTPRSPTTWASRARCRRCSSRLTPTTRTRSSGRSTERRRATASSRTSPTSSSAATACATARSRSCRRRCATCASAKATATASSRCRSWPRTATGPTPFPPGMRTVDGMPAAPASSAAAGHDVGAGPPPGAAGRGVLLWMAGLLGGRLGRVQRRCRAARRARARRRRRRPCAPAPAASRMPLHDLLRAAVRRQRLRGAHLRGGVVPPAAPGDRRVGAVGRHRAGELHGRHVPGQPAVRALRPAPTRTRCASTRAWRSASASSGC